MHSRNKPHHPKVKGRFATIGSGTVEYVLKHKGHTIELGIKHLADLTSLWRKRCQLYDETALRRLFSLSDFGDRKRRVRKKNPGNPLFQD